MPNPPTFADVADEAVALFLLAVSATPELAGVLGTFNEYVAEADACLEKIKAQVQEEMTGFKIVRELAP